MNFLQIKKILVICIITSIKVLLYSPLSKSEAWDCLKKFFQEESLGSKTVSGARPFRQLAISSNNNKKFYEWKRPNFSGEEES